jgi:cation-transporting ATPase E
VGIASTFLLSAVGFMILWKLCMPMNPYRCFVIVACVCSLILAAYFLADLFAIDYISLKCILLSAVFVLAEESMIRNFTNVTERLRRRKGVQ